MLKVYCFYELGWFILSPRSALLASVFFFLIWYFILMFFPFLYWVLCLLALLPIYFFTCISFREMSERTMY